MKKDVLNKEMGDGAAPSIHAEEGHDVGRTGYHKSNFGGEEAVNYRVEGAYQMKDESPSRLEGSKIQEIGLHTVIKDGDKLYSGSPSKAGGKDESHKGGGKNAEEN